MDRFGENWKDHDRKIFESWDSIGCDDDLLLLVGDITWAMKIEDALPDLTRIASMKGHKLMLKGNHDYWWQTTAKMTRVLDASIRIVQGSSIIWNRIAVAGTRGWVCPSDSYFKPDDARVYEREVVRLRTALRSLDQKKEEFDSLIVALHYPPVNDKHESSGFTDLIDEYRADVCVYGHLHGDDIKTALTGRRGETLYHLVSADAVDFTPRNVTPAHIGRNE